MDDTANMLKVFKSEGEILQLSNEDFKQLWHQQTKYLQFLEQLLTSGDDDFKKCESAVDKSIEQLQLDLVSVKSGAKTTASSADEIDLFSPPVESKGTLIDPCVNLLVQKLRSDLKEREKRIDNVTSELNAWQLTSTDGCTIDEKRAMARCRMLAHENNELGDKVSESRLSDFKAHLDQQKGALSEIRQDIDVCCDVASELDLDLGALQGTIMQLYQALRTKGKASSDLVASLEYNKSGSSSRSKSASRSKTTSSSSSRGVSGSSAKASKSSASSHSTLTKESSSMKASPSAVNGKHKPESGLPLKKIHNGQSSSETAATKQSDENGPMAKKPKTLSTHHTKPDQNKNNIAVRPSNLVTAAAVNGKHDQDGMEDSYIKTNEVDETMEISVNEIANSEIPAEDGSNLKVNGVKRTPPLSLENYETTLQMSN